MRALRWPGASFLGMICDHLFNTVEEKRHAMRWANERHNQLENQQVPPAGLDAQCACGTDTFQATNHRQT